MKLISVLPSNRKNKKYVATFSSGPPVHFGDSRYSDYTMHGDNDRRRRYIARHSKSLNNVPNTPGMLSLYLLWGPHTSLRENVYNYISLYDL